MKRKATDHTHKNKSYGLLILFISGDDDFGALHAEEYGVERLFDEYLVNAEEKATGLSVSSASSSKEEDEAATREFNHEIEMYTFSTREDRNTAMDAIRAVKSHVQDYDESKHSDTYTRALTTGEMNLYRRTRETKK